MVLPSLASWSLRRRESKYALVPAADAFALAWPSCTANCNRHWCCQEATTRHERVLLRSRSHTSILAAAAPTPALARLCPLVLVTMGKGKPAAAAKRATGHHSIKHYFQCCSPKARGGARAAPFRSLPKRNNRASPRAPSNMTTLSCINTATKPASHCSLPPSTPASSQKQQSLSLTPAQQRKKKATKIRLASLSLVKGTTSRQQVLNKLLPPVNGGKLSALPSPTRTKKKSESSEAGDLLESKGLTRNSRRGHAQNLPPRKRSAMWEASRRWRGHRRGTRLRGNPQDWGLTATRRKLSGC